MDVKSIKEISDKALLHDFLIRDRISAAYHLGDLDPHYFGYCRWWGAFDSSDVLEAVLLLYTGLRTPAVLTVGSADGIDAVCQSKEVRAALPTRFYAHIMNEHLAAMQQGHHVDDLRPMMRMGLTRDAFVPVEDDVSVVRPVTHADTAELMELYRFYPDNFFEPYQLEAGFYFGCREDGRLVSVAGVHVFSEDFDVAAIGNIVTHPDYRSRGHSRRCTTVLMTHLFDRVSTAALNVQRDNLAARRVYERLGFTDHVKYLEGPVSSR